ncbi:MAG: hypothetical protein JXJ04_05915, partial [Spirochaetales bacterium]|nr:hypothetical protein [Spirochaetales bacterium]
MGDIKIKKGIFSSHIAKLIPFFIFIFLIAILAVTTNLSGRSPEVFLITPKVGIPGKELIIKGKYFGKERNGGKVSFS